VSKAFYLPKQVEELIQGLPNSVQTIGRARTGLPGRDDQVSKTSQNDDLECVLDGVLEGLGHLRIVPGSNDRHVLDLVA